MAKARIAKEAGMELRRFIVELGMGADLHGQDVTKASQRAIKDAVSRCCLCGLIDIFDFKHPNEMHINLKVACPSPEKVDREKLKSAVPFGQVNLELVEGGMVTQGLNLPLLGEGDRIVVAIASITVLVDVEAHPIKLGAK
ncbi:MAG: Lin0512 family protein [Deltaproteobacteria bacterium]|nr:Lin0512 family protein [Deltaproteobacteria bacterium]